MSHLVYSLIELDQIQIKCELKCFKESYILCSKKSHLLYPVIIWPKSLFSNVFHMIYFSLEPKFMLGVIQKPYGYNFALFWPPTCPCGHFLCTEHGQKWQILDQLPTLCCSCCFWMAPYVKWHKGWYHVECL